MQATKKSSALEPALDIVLVKREEVTSRSADLRKHVPRAIDLALALEAVLPAEFEFGVQARLREGLLWGAVCL